MLSTFGFKENNVETTKVYPAARGEQVHLLTKVDGLLDAHFTF